MPFNFNVVEYELDGRILGRDGREVGCFWIFEISISFNYSRSSRKPTKRETQLKMISRSVRSRLERTLQSYLRKLFLRDF